MSGGRTSSGTDVRKLPRIKLSDQVAEDVRRQIARDSLQPGDRLPNERALMERYACSKGTIREALKALEVEGLVRMVSGPNGGPEVQSSSIDIVMQQLRQYLHFQTVDFKHVYELRKVLEVILVENVIGKLTEDQYRRLEENITLCEEANQRAARSLVRAAETEFHDILCEACDNVILVFMCRFLNAMLRDLVSFRSSSMTEHERFGDENIASHRQLLAALRANDAQKAGQIMHEHMCCAEGFMRRLDASFRSDLLSRF